jgi:hypothetical protein
MRACKPSLVSTALLLTIAAAGAAPAVPDANRPISPASRITAVTLYQTSALVAREVAVPEGTGKMELVLTGLPPSIDAASIYGEGSGDIRVLSTRYRTTPLPQTSQEDLRKLETQLKDLRKQEAVLNQQIEALQTNLAFVGKLENFTGATMQSVTEKGQLSAEAVTKISQFVMDSRTNGHTTLISLRQQVETGREQQVYLQREMQRLSGTSDKTSREAIVVIDKAAPQAGKVSVFYLVSAASWRPQYKIRANPDKKEVQVEYLAAMRQATGEDWSGVDLTLSTAMPIFSATPPELVAMEVQPSGRVAPNRPGVSAPAQPGLNIDGARFDMNAAGEGKDQQKMFFERAASNSLRGNKSDADRDYNLVATMQQAAEISESMLDQRPSDSHAFREGQSVTFRLERKLSIPWRDDEQVIEVARSPLQADFFYKAVPVLTQHVYRLASLTNSSELVILPGQATMYVGNDFVGRATLPLVASGQTFTAGFGVDPQIQVKRDLVEKTRTVQGGNQVQKFDYRLTVSSYKKEPVRLELWDRLPYAEGEAVNITMLAAAPTISKDEAYARDEQPKGLLRWDLTLDPNTSGEKAQRITYQYKLEHAREQAVDNFFNRALPAK